MGQELKINTSIFANLEGIVADDAVFEAEHGVNIHLPFIAHYFKNATVTPILLTRNITKHILVDIITRIPQTADDHL